MVISGTFGHQVNSDIHLQTVEITMRPSYQGIHFLHRLTKQTVKILMRRLVRSRLIWIFTVCMSEFT